MKKIQLIISLLLLLSMTVYSQEKSVVIAEYSKSSNIIVNTENKSTTTFETFCSKDAIDAMQIETDKYSNYISFSATKDGDRNSFIVSISYNHVAQPMEFYKIMMTIGITGLKVEGKEQPLDYLLNIK